MILDCEFCENSEHFTNRCEAVDEGWNWMNYEFKDGSILQTVACPRCDADRVRERHEEKREILTYCKSSEKPETERNQETLQVDN